MPVDNELPPICACCLEVVGDVWAVTNPAVYLICGKSNCERWASAQGLWFWTTSAQWRRSVPAVTTTGRPRRPAGARRPAPTCDQCHKTLPTARRNQFLDGPRRYCTLTCMEKARGGGTRRVTEQEIDNARTERGGWTKATLAEWGVPWPPPKGWRKRLVGAG